MAQARDLTNQRFGRLVCLEKAASRNRHTYWLCECDCGNKKEIQTSHLTSGAIISCGCERNNANINKKCILCGKEFLANNIMRKYCFDCSPQGLTPTEGLRSRKRALKHFLVQYKGGKCCQCGYNKCEGALQFHHINQEEKDFTLSHINLNDTDFSIEIIKQEVDKCILLCANCHAEKHYIED